jgi:hypothetical protein
MPSWPSGQPEILQEAPGNYVKMGSTALNALRDYAKASRGSRIIRNDSNGGSNDDDAVPAL